MSLPLWDPIQIPPEFTLVDVNSIQDDAERERCQSMILDLWLEENGIEHADEVVREWDDNEGAFVIYDTAGVSVGVTIILDVENA